MTIRATITGRLGKDAEFRTLQDGTPVANFSVASDDRSKKDAPTQWVRCALFGRRAQAVLPYLTKGKQVVIAGTLSMREYQGKDGAARAGLECRVEDVELMGGKSDGGAETSAAPQRSAAPAADFYGQAADGFSDDVPF